MAVAAAAAGIGGGVLIGSGVVWAHEPAFELSCDGARLTGVGYEDGQTNVATIEIDGAVAFHVDDFGTSIDQTVAIPQDGVAHTVRFVVDAQGDGTEGHPEYDLDVTQSVGPCGEVTTTTSTTTTTTTTTIPDTTTTTTTPDSTTTTTPDSTSTTTTIPGTLSVAAFAPVCVRDAPFIDVTFGNQPEFNGHTATVTFIDLDGNVVATHTATYQAGTTLRFIYPGAVVDANGNPIDWPGWVFDGDEWVPDPTDDRLRDGLTVVVEVNPTATGTVEYPPATPACNANPPTSSTGGGLPETGAYSVPMILLASALVAGGIASS